MLSSSVGSATTLQETTMKIETAEGYSYEPVPTVKGAIPYPPDLLAKSKDLLQGTLALLEGLGPCEALARAVMRRYPVHAERTTQAAGVIGVSPVGLMTGNLCYDILAGTGAMACSTLALPGEDGPVLARNMDWFPAEKIAKASCVVREEYGENAGFLGMLGVVTGMSKAGFGLCLNAAFAGTDPQGYPMLLFLRHVMDTATSFADALEMLQRERLMSGGIITLVGTRNDERAIMERGPTAAVVRRAIADEPLMATNHFRALASPQECSRYECMAERVGEVPALEVLTDRRVLQEITAQHVVMCPATQSCKMFVPTHLREAPSVTVLVSDLLKFVG